MGRYSHTESQYFGDLSVFHMRRTIDAYFSRYSKFLLSESHYRCESSSFQLGLACLKRTFQDIARFRARNFNSCWLCLIPSGTRLRQAYFARYSQEFMHTTLDSLLIPSLQEGITWINHTFRDLSRFLWMESHFLGEFSLIKPTRACIKCTFQDIARFLCTVSLFLGEFSSFQGRCTFIKHTFPDTARYSRIDSQFHGESSVSQGGRATVMRTVKDIARSLLRDSLLVVNSLLSRQGSLLSSVLFKILQAFHPWNVRFLAHSLQYNQDALVPRL